MRSAVHAQGTAADGVHAVFRERVTDLIGVPDAVVGGGSRSHYADRQHVVHVRQPAVHIKHGGRGKQIQHALGILLVIDANQGVAMPSALFQNFFRFRDRCGLELVDIIVIQRSAEPPLLLSSLAKNGNIFVQLK